MSEEWLLLVAAAAKGIRISHACNLLLLLAVAAVQAAASLLLLSR